MNKKVSIKSLFAAVIIAVSTTAVIAVIAVKLTTGVGFTSNLSAYKKTGEIFSLIENNYLNEYDQIEVQDMIARGMLTALDDPYAMYYSQADAEAQLENLNGNAIGLGITVFYHSLNKTVLIKNVYSDSAAQDAGLKPFDEIVSINGELVADNGYQKSMEMLKGELGNTINLIVSRGAQEVEISVVIRKNVKQSIFFEMLDNSLGYILVNEFNTATVEQFKEAIDQLSTSGVTGLIFDVRGNSGGTVDSVVAMLDYILPEGDLMSVSYKSGKREVISKSDKQEVNLPMVVLTDNASASASEIFTQAIIDYKKGISIGAKTYGKGVMQHTYELSDGSLIKFTIAKFYSPDGICVDGIGVIPEIEISLTDDEKMSNLMSTPANDTVVKRAVEYMLK